MADAKWNGWSTPCRLGLPTCLPLPSAALLAIYAYFIPSLKTTRRALHDAMAFRNGSRVVRHTVGPGGVAALGLYWSLLLPRFWRDPAFFLTLTTFSLFFFYKTRIVARAFLVRAWRFLAVTLPGTLLCLAAFADDLVGRARLAALWKRMRPADRRRAKRRTIAGWPLPARSVWFWG